MSLWVEEVAIPCQSLWPGPADAGEAALRRLRETVGEVGDLRVRIRELPMADGVHASTGCQLWSASVVLACELMRRPVLVAGKTVLEVGAGCGLLGIAAARLARRTLITDGDAEAVQNLTHNLQANEASWRARGAEAPREASARQLRWDEVVRDGWPLDERFEVIVASDVIYGHWGDVVAEAMLRMLSVDGHIWMAASEDRRSGIKAFTDHLTKHDFHVEEVKLEVPLGNFRTYVCRKRLPGDPSDHPPVLRRTEMASPWSQVAMTASASSSPARAQAAPAVADGGRVSLEAAPPSSGGGANGYKAATSGCGANGHKASAIWRVVGGQASRGIIARGGFEGPSSTYLGRLAHGAVVEECERSADAGALRLRYRLLQGAGPAEGWVTVVSGKGKMLLEKDAGGKADDGPAAAAL